MLKDRPAFSGGGTPVECALVVDDDPVILRLIQARLRARGYAVLTAVDGEKALELIQTRRPDLIFLDIILPGIGGIDVLERVRAAEMDTAVVMTTAFGSEQAAIAALLQGADDYLRKPFETREFQAVLDRTVTRLQMHRQNLALRRQLDDNHRQLETELARAGQLQVGLLPTAAPEMSGFEVAARCLPAREVSGDFYDWEEAAPGLVTLTLGDSTGRGMSAALLMATIRGTLRAVARQSPPAAALELVARALQVDFQRAGSYMSIFHARLNVDVRRLYYVDAGHGHVFVRRADGRAEELAAGGPPLGVFTEQKYQGGSLTFRAGDALVVYSDGIVNARPELALNRAMLANHLYGAHTAADIANRLLALPELSGPPSEDLTVLVLRCTEDA